MAFKLPKNSLFAILLRSSWWISFAIAGALSLIAMALLPEAYRAVGALSSFPFVVIGVIALRRQWNLPGSQEIARASETLSTLNWQSFVPLAQAALEETGRVVRPHKGEGAEFVIHDNGGCRLVSARRWKSARLGIESLRELIAAFDAAGARGGIIMCLGEITEPARKLAQSSAIEIWGAPELAARLRGKLPPP